jgi:predicted NUDIX family NTP pyrophosphohydrolase
MPARSAGILAYRFEEGRLQVMLVHPGGPFWSKKDQHAWSIPKGLYEKDEDPLKTAVREFNEETGFTADGPFIELGEHKQSHSKTITVWALEQDFDVSNLTSNTFTLEWPKNSGNVKDYPEVDKAQWFTIETARKKILKGQQPFLDRLTEKLQHQNQSR